MTEVAEMLGLPQIFSVVVSRNAVNGGKELQKVSRPHRWSSFTTIEEGDALRVKHICNIMESELFWKDQIMVAMARSTFAKSRELNDRKRRT